MLGGWFNKYKGMGMPHHDCAGTYQFAIWHRFLGVQKKTIPVPVELSGLNGIVLEP